MHKIAESLGLGHHSHASNPIVDNSSGQSTIDKGTEDALRSPEGSATLNRIHFGVSRAIGTRDYQEDEYTCIDNLSINKGPAYFAVFDGHGSDQFSAHSSSNTHTIIFNSEAFKSGNYDQAIREGILNVDKELFAKYGQNPGGSTATVCLIAREAVHLGNVGDSRAIVGLYSNGRLCAKRLSRDHKPDDADERDRINRAGGSVSDGRVRGEFCAINMSRAVGDFSFKTPQNNSGADWIASEPFMARPVPMVPDVRFLVLASDGLWNVIEDNEVALLVAKLYKQGLKPDSIAATLVNKCVKTPLADNTTVIVVFFDFVGNMFKGNVNTVTNSPIQGAARPGEVIISEHSADE